MSQLSAEKFYTLLSSWRTGINDSEVNEARLVFDVRSRFNSLWDYDPVTGEALITDLYMLLSRYRRNPITCDCDCPEYNDWLKQIADYAEPAIEHLIHQLHNRIVRKHAVLPLHAVRKTDAKTVSWLNSKPGRNVREKLAGSPRMLAVEHLQSFDTSENRLLKACIIRLCKLLELRQRAVNALHSDASYKDDLVLQLHRWLRSDAAKTIGRWENLPPNNTLLSDQNYCKIWKSWCRLQQIDGDIQKDFKHLNSGRLALMSVSLAAYMQRNPSVRLVQQPVICAYDTFGITPALGMIFGYARTDKNNYGNVEVELEKSQISVSLPGSFFRIPDDWFASKPELTTAQNDDFIHRLLAKKKLPVPQATHNSRRELVEACEAIILDVTQLQPSYLACFRDGTKAKAAQQVPFRLVEQYWKLQESSTAGEFEIDCGRASALQQDDNQNSIETLTMRDVISSNSSQHKESRTTSTGRLFAKKMARYFNDPEVCTYLIPDSGDDFSLELVRKSMNFGFRVAEPLPRSIARVFQWQSSKAFEAQHIQNGDIVLVTDADDSVCTIIPLKAKHRSTVEKELLHTKGITWERLPPYELYVNQKTTSRQSADGLLPDLLQQGFSNADIATASGRLTVRIGSEESYHVTSADIGPQKQIRAISEYKSIREKYRKQATAVHELSVETSGELLTGARALQVWQKQVPDTPLWRDHLPQLAMQAEKMSGEEVRIELVGDSTTVVPRRGESVNIPVDDGFILPAGKTFYEFPLIQGGGLKKQKYYAYLHHASFPLKTDVECRLELTYTYGDNSPYDLRFVPVNGRVADFTHIKVVWNSRSMRDWLNLPFPGFPEQDTWDAMTRVPKKGRPGETIDCTGQWLPSEFRKIDGVNLHGWRQYTLSETMKTKNGDNYWIIELGNGSKAAVYENKVLKAEAATPFTGGERVYAYVVEQKYGKLQAVDVSRNPQPDECFLAGSIRFPALSVWNHGRSLQDADVPNDFRLEAMKAIHNSEKIIANKEIPEVMKNEMRRFLSYLHKDAPQSYSAELQQFISNENLFKHRYKDIGYVIGDAKLNWQRELFNYVIQRVERNCVMGHEILAISLWRNKDLVFNLKSNQVNSIVSSLINYFHSVFYGVDSDIKGIDGKITKHIELVLALCRLRDSDDEDIKRELSPQYSKQFKELQELIEQPLGEAVKNNKWSLESLLSLEIANKNESVPDILYAARVYVSGREESNSIRIVRVNV
ncbi:DUF2357 domain-containing protein [Spirochaeta dissipatitropha]